MTVFKWLHPTPPIALAHRARSPLGAGDLLSVARWGWPSVALRSLAVLGILVGISATLGPGRAVGQVGSEGDFRTTTPEGVRSGRETLDDVVDEALRNDPGYAQARSREEEAGAELREARSRYLPTLTLDSRYTEQSGTVDLGAFVNPVYAELNRISGVDRFPTDVSYTFPVRHDSRVRLVQPLFDRSIGAGHEAARYGRDGARAERVSAARDLAARAQVAFLAVGAARSARRTWEATLPRVVEAERVAERLVSAGTATPDAVFRARAERSEVEQRLLEAAEEERAAARSFNRLLGRDLDAPVDSIPEENLLFPIEISEEEAVARATDDRSDLRAVEAARRASDAGIRAAGAGSLPRVSLALDYGFQGRDLTFGRDEDYWTASFLVSWNLFDGGRNGALEDAARAEATRRDLRGDEVRDLIRLEVRQAYHAAVVAREAVSTAEARLAAARRTFDLVRRRYEEGLATQVEFLDARSALTSAELNRVAIIHRYATRWVELERAVALRDRSELEVGP